MRHVSVLCSIAFDAKEAPLSRKDYIFIYLLTYNFLVNLFLGCCRAEPQFWPENCITGIVFLVTLRGIWSM